MLSPRVERRAKLDVIRAVLTHIPSLKDVRLEDAGLERLGGAMTNVSYKLTTHAGAYVLRLAGEGTSDYVDRSAEGHNARVAAAVGINAEVLYFDPREGTMLTRFVQGVGMDGEGFSRDPGAPVRAVMALKRVHGMGRVFKSRFDVFAMIDGYLDLLRDLRMPLPEDYHELGREMATVRRALEASPVPLVPCHNDPWPGNLLDTGGSIYIIDWEYSGMNDPMWDLGDLSVEAGFTPEQDRTMMEAYYGGVAPAALYSRLEIYKAMSDFHWSLWGMVQHANDNPAEDFRSYALERLEHCKERTGSTDFGRHLALARVGRQPRASRHGYRANQEWRASLLKAPGGGQRLASSPSSPPATSAPPRSTLDRTHR